jgi:hypothetical protein
LLIAPHAYSPLLAGIVPGRVVDSFAFTGASFPDISGSSSGATMSAGNA